MEASFPSRSAPRRHWSYWFLTVVLLLVFGIAGFLCIGTTTVTRELRSAWGWFTTPNYRTVSATEIVIPSAGTTEERFEAALDFLKENDKLGRFTGMTFLGADSVRIFLSPAGHPR